MLAAYPLVIVILSAPDLIPPPSIICQSICDASPSTGKLTSSGLQMSKSKNDLVAECTLKNMSKPMLPQELCRFR